MRGHHVGGNLWNFSRPHRVKQSLIFYGHMEKNQGFYSMCVNTCTFKFCSRAVNQSPSLFACTCTMFNVYQNMYSVFWTCFVCFKLMEGFLHGVGMNTECVPLETKRMWRDPRKSRLCPNISPSTAEQVLDTASSCVTKELNDMMEHAEA